MKSLKSCCGIDLRIGGCILGCLGIIGGVLGIAYFLNVLANIVPEEGYVVLITGVYLLRIISVLTIVFDALWIYGIYKNSHKLMLPALILTMTACVVILAAIGCYIIVDFYLAITLPYVSREKYVIIAVVSLVVYLLVSVVVAYLTAVRYSLYKNIMERNQRVTIASNEKGLWQK